jgi:hypothetical protein
MAVRVLVLFVMMIVFSACSPFSKGGDESSSSVNTSGNGGSGGGKNRGGGKDKDEDDEDEDEDGDAGGNGKGKGPKKNTGKGNGKNMLYMCVDGATYLIESNEVDSVVENEGGELGACL